MTFRMRTAATAVLLFASVHAASAQTVTLSGVPPGNHSLLLYTVQVPLEFFNMNFSVVTILRSTGTLSLKLRSSCPAT